ncbi:outer membrane beta-barrel protein [Rhodanobacter sp. C03]|uniref:outer membrane beta-barrel protein n=1 Tax=Rhodanobacter sp. C03 TaxID=1945858 RepID=UPI00098747CD|nr:outer membrane beta-barrel protein [Rhodanobacter sp. C03]OOG59895.1 hypothetical protein B0E48_03680 [Rhodanobacter sp. C03]
MNKRFHLTAIAVALAAVSTTSFATDPGAFFINGNLGQSHYNDNGFSDRTDVSVAVRGGYSWQSDVVDFGVETGYVDLGKAHGTVTDGAISANYSAQGKGPLLGINLKYKFVNKWFVSGRLGYFRSTLVENISGFGSQSYSGNGGYAGVGVGYDITPHFSLGASYDNYRGRVKYAGSSYADNIGVVSGFAEYRF